MRRQNKEWRLSIDQCINPKASIQKRAKLPMAMMASFRSDPMNLAFMCYRATGKTLRTIAEGGGRL